MFMPVGTQATIKGAFLSDIIKTGAQIILSNTYHLMIRLRWRELVHRVSSLPIYELLFTNFDWLRRISSNVFIKVKQNWWNLGAIFNSHIDGKKLALSPEESIRIQRIKLDIVMVMDECPKTNDYELIKKSRNFQCCGQKDQKSIW